MSGAIMEDLGTKFASNGKNREKVVTRRQVFDSARSTMRAGVSTMATPMTAIILDFDTNKLVHLYGDHPRRQAAQDRARSQMLGRLATVLQTSIELPEILRLFLQEVNRLIPLQGVSFSHAASNYEHFEGEVSGHTVHYRLQTREDYLGEISFHRNGERYAESELAMLESLLASLVYPLRNGLRYQEALRSALTDALTGVGNRVSMENVMKREFDLATRYDQPLSLLMLDLDHFKRINDTYGHAAGDYVIKTVAKTLRAASRNADMTFRYGGEEFVLMLNKTDANGARITAERLRSTIAGLAIISEGREIPVTISVGIASLKRGENLQQFLERADQALYQAKYSGRNRVMQADAAPGTLVGDADVRELPRPATVPQI